MSDAHACTEFIQYENLNETMHMMSRKIKKPHHPTFNMVSFQNENMLKYFVLSKV